VFDDPLIIAGAIAGAVVAVVLLVRLDWWSAPPADGLPMARPKLAPTGYASTAQPTATPVLFALSAALVGVGLVLTSSGLHLGFVLLGVGGGLLLVTFVLSLRTRPAVGREVQDVEDRPATEDHAAD
jgi:hypothetical protein